MLIDGGGVLIGGGGVLIDGGAGPQTFTRLGRRAADVQYGLTEAAPQKLTLMSAGGRQYGRGIMKGDAVLLQVAPRHLW